MPPKQKAPAPIDRPLSRAYLRQFTGWSTAYPPGQSEPTSLREIENMFVDKNGALAVRPGLRYLSYKNSPDLSPTITGTPGTPIDVKMVGTQEPFYVLNGDKALLCAVRESEGGPVGFRAILFTGATATVYRLTDPRIGFDIPQGESVLNFTPATTHVEYVQIDNKIIALSDAGEAIRIFYVGTEKLAKRINGVSKPTWDDSEKLIVRHPTADWINKQTVVYRRNELVNPSFEIGTTGWNLPKNGVFRTYVTGALSGTQVMEVQSAPTRTNMQTSPLHNVSATGITGWHSHPDWGNPTLTADGDFLRITDKKGKGTFLAYGAKLSQGVQEGQRYQVAVSYELGADVQPIVVLTFYNAAGAKIGKSVTKEMPKTAGRYASGGIPAPPGTVTMRVSVGGRNEKSAGTFVKVRHVMLCKEDELTTFFEPTGANTFWTGVANQSALVVHPPQDVTFNAYRVAVPAGSAVCGSIYAYGSVAKTVTAALRVYDKNSVLLNNPPAATSGTAPAGSWGRISSGNPAINPLGVQADLQVTVKALARGEVVLFDSAMLESGTSSPLDYFDGSTPPTNDTIFSWGNRDAPHQSYSVSARSVEIPAIPNSAVPNTGTLISSGDNPYKMGFFYTFENEVGESAASKITEVRTMRPWSNWRWEKPGTDAAPGGPGAATQTADLCADQLAVFMPQSVYDQAIREGATKWNLYVMAWSDQEPVPVTALLVAEKDLYPDEATTLRANSLPYTKGGIITITPARKVGINDAILPTLNNRVNYSRPPRTRKALVAGDRMIMLGDPDELATIRWTSNRPGEYTNFTASRGGGAKTLTTGNLNIPADVVLWQNPQSVDTLTILCMGSDGQSNSYYMTPAAINAQSGSTQVMGFEETTSTPGTMSPYANEVMNNALYRPIDRALLKSTAANYNINHKTVTDKIANQWWQLRSKRWMMSAQMDNKIYYLVHNPLGETLEKDCKGNEIWVYDNASESGAWSRFLIQGVALRVFNVGSREYVGVTRPDGLYYLDPDARLDDFVDVDGLVRQRAIPWRFLTNTQGANRAHDAWAHLQMIQVTLGNFLGTIRYGLRGQDIHGQMIDVSKEFTDPRLGMEVGQTWDVDDILQIRRDMKEWFLYAESVPGKPGSGQLGYVQYRYTPVSVNVGYEYGSVETFEYGSNVALGPSVYSENGIPLPAMDYSRP